MTSSCMPLWSENPLDIISILLNLLRLILFPSMWSAPETEPLILEKNVYSVFWGEGIILNVSIKSNFYCII